MTILISFHQNHSRNFKHFYLEHVQKTLGGAFPTLPSYQRFVEWMPGALVPLCAYLKHCFGHSSPGCKLRDRHGLRQCTGIGFVDSTSVKVCHIRLRRGFALRRISRNKVFKDFAARGKTSVDWFFGLKLHIVVNEHGEILNAIVTAGNIDDRKPIPDLVSGLFGQIFADRGYVSKQLAEQLFKEFGIEFFAKPRRHMKKRCDPATFQVARERAPRDKLMRLHDKLL